MRDPGSPQRTRMLVAIPRAERLGRVLENGDSVLLACLHDRGQVGRLSVQVHDHDGSWQPTQLRAAIQLLSQQVRIKIPRAALRIQKDWFGAQIHYREG